MRRLSAEGVGRCRAVDNAVAYRYECYDREDLSEQLVTGAVATADQRHLQVSPLVLDHLESSKSYWCRVVAISADGRISATSDPRRLTRTD